MSNITFLFMAMNTLMKKKNATHAADVTLLLIFMTKLIYMVGVTSFPFL